MSSGLTLTSVHTYSTDTSQAVTPNDGEIMTYSAITNFDVAICLLCAILVPRLTSRHRLFHRSLRKSPEWVEQHAVITPASVKAAEDGYAGGSPILAAANTAVNVAMLQAIALSFIVYLITAITLSMLSRNLDIRTTYILKGISYFIGAACIFLLSFCAPQWLGVYAHAGDLRRTDLGSSLQSLKMRARLCTLQTFVTIYPFMIPFFCGAWPATIPASIIVGLLMGFFLCLVIDWGNRTIKGRRHLQIFALFLALCLVGCSAYLFAYGCGYVEDVWGDRKNEAVTTVDKVTFSVWLIVGCFNHILVWRFTKREESEAEYHQEVTRPQTFFGQSVYLSKRPSNNAFLSPSELINKPAAHSQPDLGVIGEGEEGDEDDTTNNNSQSLKEPSSNPLPASSTTALEEQQTADKDTQEEEQHQEQPVLVVPEHNSDNDEHGEPNTVEMKLNSNRRDMSDDEEQPPNNTNDKGEENHKNSYENENEDEDDEDEENKESTCQLVNIVCCHHACGKKGKRSTGEKAVNCARWTFWFLCLAGSIFFVCIMVGSMQQEKTVKKYLPMVKDILYGTMNTGPQCAFDNRDFGDNWTRREKVENTQRSFDTPEEVQLAGYTILHCGACGKCSNWHDLRLEYATRNVLGQIALECAKKSLFGGGYMKLLDCTMEKTTFLEPCARCWATDYECTRNNCMWIGLRSFMINTVTNLQVGENDITPATCEEAMCEATEITGYEGFVPCSGASRRRMNVTSTISRPSDQQCTQVGVVWEDFFGPSEGYLDYDPSYDNLP